MLFPDIFEIYYQRKVSNGVLSDALDQFSLFQNAARMLSRLFSYNFFFFIRYVLAFVSVDPVLISAISSQFHVAGFMAEFG